MTTLTTAMQTAFNKAFLGVYHQGGPAATGTEDDVVCKYTQGDHHCGIGHILPKRFLTPSIEGNGILALLYHYNPSDEPDSKPILKSSALAKWAQKTFDLPVNPNCRWISQITQDNLRAKFLCVLQNAHDRAARQPADTFMPTFCDNMREVAEQFGLKTTVIDDVQPKVA